MTLAKSLREVGFYTLAGVENVRREGENVVGRWKENLHRFYGPKNRSLAEDFANWSSDEEGALHFTKLYGPLLDSPRPGKEFRFRFKQWAFDQRRFRDGWEHLRPQPGVVKGFGDFQGGRSADDSWEYLNGHLAYRAPNLWRFLILELLSVPAERLRKCGRPDCNDPYFIARHLNQNYCSEVCARWGQRQWKLKWWNEVGKKRRARSKKSQRKRGK